MDTFSSLPVGICFTAKLLSDRFPYNSVLLMVAAISKMAPQGNLQTALLRYTSGKKPKPPTKRQNQLVSHE